ncbi:hypothetical protein IWQ61_008850 [Dispira simplex]|nr:hypothetical protein IWQ61_008850 [Dispira simplex]
MSQSILVADAVILLQATSSVIKKCIALNLHQVQHVYRATTLRTTPYTLIPRTTLTENTDKMGIDRKDRPATFTDKRTSTEATATDSPMIIATPTPIKEPLTTTAPPIASWETRKAAEPTLIDNEWQKTPLKSPVYPDDAVTGARILTESRMPASRGTRLWHYGSLAAGLGLGAFQEGIRRAVGISSATGSPFINPANADRLVAKLSKMRGAALKLGQMLSIQDNQAITGELARVLARVQNSANYMPRKQMLKILHTEWGPTWREQLVDFNHVPFAAASIGQVHAGKVTLSEMATGLDAVALDQLCALHPSRTSFGELEVAVKIQYPGVGNSIDSDLNNLQSLLVMGNFLPKGLYLENTIRVAQRELKWETDYHREAQCLSRFRSLLADDPTFRVPQSIPALNTQRILVTEMLQGITIGQVAQADQTTRNWVATKILELCLREIFEFQYMQTDPNWCNFLYNPTDRTIGLLDFGASRAFDDQFIDLYMKVLQAAVHGDRLKCRTYSQELGFLTGYETQQMADIHVDSVMALGEPFSEHAPTLFHFGQQTVVQRVEHNIPYMLEHRLTPPPEETYSLHRKLSGAFLLCTKLKAQVPCSTLFRDVVTRYYQRKGIPSDH